MILLLLGFFDWLVANAVGAVVCAGFFFLLAVSRRRIERETQAIEAEEFLADLNRVIPIEGRTLKRAQDELGAWYPEQHDPEPPLFFDALSTLRETRLNLSWSPAPWQPWYAEVA